MIQIVAGNILLMGAAYFIYLRSLRPSAGRIQHMKRDNFNVSSRKYSPGLNNKSYNTKGLYWKEKKIDLTNKGLNYKNKPDTALLNRPRKRFDPIADQITNPFLLYVHRLRRRFPGYPSKVVLQIAGVRWRTLDHKLKELYIRKAKHHAKRKSRHHYRGNYILKHHKPHMVHKSCT